MNEDQKVAEWMESLGFHLEQDMTPVALRKSEHWVSNDTPEQSFYPHNVAQDLATFFYKAQQADRKRLLDKVASDVIGEDVDKNNPMFKQHDFGFMSANAINNQKKNERTALDQIRKEEL